MKKPHIHVPYNRLYDYLDIIQKEKFNLEIYFDALSLDEIKEEDIEKLKRALSYEPSLSFHGPFLDLSPGAFDKKVRDITIERFLQVLDIAEKIRPKVIVFHSGYNKWNYNSKVNKWLEQSLFTWERVLPKAESIGVKIAIENIFEETSQNLRALVEKINSPNFGICFDTGHFNLFATESLEEWFNNLKPFIHEFHLHDNHGKSDEHLAIGSGKFDFKRLFSLAKDLNCVHTIEAHSPEEVLKSINNFNSLINLE